jgi:hypothetical protein
MSRRSVSIWVSLAFEVGPGAHQAGPLVGEPRQFDLEASLPGPRPAGKDLEDQAGPVYHLDLPSLLQVALLDGSQTVVDDDHVCIQGLAEGCDFLDLPGSEQGRWRALTKVDEQTVPDLEVKRPRQPFGFLQTRLRTAPGDPSVPLGMDDQRALDGRLTADAVTGQSISSSEGS